jgi:hypothetical protein
LDEPEEYVGEEGDLSAVCWDICGCVAAELENELRPELEQMLEWAISKRRCPVDASERTAEDVNVNDPQFSEDWEKAVLFVCLLTHGLPSWAAGHNQPKALAALCGWDEQRAKNALEEAGRRGMLERKDFDEEDSSAE